MPGVTYPEVNLPEASVDILKVDNYPFLPYADEVTSHINDHEMSRWQSGKSVLSCNRVMLEQQIACDIWFHLGPFDQIKIGAHQYVLRSRSASFFALLDGSGDDVWNIKLPDVQPQIFWQFLQYMYCEELHLESGTVFKLLALTDKIEAASVREQCLRFLYTCLSLDTACDILEIAHHYNDMDLTEASMLFIRKQVKDVLQSAGRKNLCRECLDKVLQVKDCAVDTLAQVKDGVVDTLVQVEDCAVDAPAQVMQVKDDALAPMLRVNDGVVDALAQVVQVNDGAVDTLAQVKDSVVDTLVQVEDCAVDAPAQVMQVKDGAVDALAPMLRVNDGVVDALAQVVQVNDGAVDTLAQVVQIKDGAVDTLAHVVQVKDCAVDALAQVVQVKDGAVDTLAQVVQVEDGAVAALAHKQEIGGPQSQLQSMVQSIDAAENNVSDSCADGSDHRSRNKEDCHQNVLDSCQQDNKYQASHSPTHKDLMHIAHSNDSADTMSYTSTSSMESYATLSSEMSRHLSLSTLPDVRHVTRFQEVGRGCVTNGGSADAISFVVDQNIHLYGFGVYGAERYGEAFFRVDTVVSRKKRDILMESISITGVGVILPVMFDRPVKVEKSKVYTLEIYMHGPKSHCGAHGLESVGDMMSFNFRNATAVKRNRTTVRSGQIPRLYFMPA